LFELRRVLFHLPPRFRHAVANAQGGVLDRIAASIGHTHLKIAQGVLAEVLEHGGRGCVYVDRNTAPGNTRNFKNLEETAKTGVKKL